MSYRQKILRTDTPDRYILKCCDDTALLSSLSDSDKPWLHQSGVNKVAESNDNKALEINTNTSEESVSGPLPDSHQVPIVVHNEKN